MANKNFLNGFIVGMSSVASIVILVLVLIGEREDISYSHTQIDTDNTTVEIFTNVKGLEYPGGYTFAGGAGEKLSFSELLDQSKRDFYHYYWFEQVNINDSLDIEKIEIKLWFRNNKVGVMRRER